MYGPNMYQNTMNPNTMAGGYPYGYPPNMPQMGMYNNPLASPFPNPQQLPLAPGTPLEITMSNGNSGTIPATGFNPGGATINQGGFNPVTGMVTQPVGGQGFNPYAQAIGSQGYMGMPGGFNNNLNQGFDIYDPSKKYQYQQQFVPPMGGYGVYSPMGICNPYGQNQFNYTLQQFLYNEDESSMDVASLLEQIVLTDEERDKINHNKSYIIGQDYYGRPIYNNGMGAYQINQQRQQELENARQECIDYCTKLSRIAHAGAGEEINEEAVRKRFDPMPQQQSQKVFNFYSATEEEKKEYERDMMINRARELNQRFDQAEKYNNYLNLQKEAAYAQIKASYDKMIGVEPGEHYNLKTFLDNAYKINISIAHANAKAQNRNGTNKYSRNDFRANLSQKSNLPVPVTSKDDEYVSIETMLKGIYNRNRQVNTVLKNGTGQVVYGSAQQTPEFNSEMESHQYFLQAIQDKKNADDVRKSVTA